MANLRVRLPSSVCAMTWERFAPLQYCMVLMQYFGSPSAPHVQRCRQIKPITLWEEVTGALLLHTGSDPGCCLWTISAQYAELIAFLALPSDNLRMFWRLSQ